MVSPPHSRSFGELIRARREAAGLSQAALGELVDRSASTVRAWERGQSLPGEQETLEKLAAALDISREELATVLDPARLSFEPEGLLEPVPAEEEVSGGPSVVEDAPPPPLWEETAEHEEPEVLPLRLQDQILLEDLLTGRATEVEPAPLTEEEEEGEGSPPVVLIPRQEELATELSPPPPVTEPVVWEVPSYLEDPEQVELYRVRAALTVIILLGLVAVLVWAFRELREAVGAVLDLF